MLTDSGAYSWVLAVIVNLPPSPNANQALAELYETVSTLQITHPEVFYIIAGDFNLANLKSVVPRFFQHVNFATRGENCLKIVYTKAYKGL